MPENLRSFAHIVIIPKGFAVFGDTVLCAVHEIFSLLKAFRLHDAVQKDFLILDTGRLVFFLRWPQQVIHWFKDSLKPSIEPDMFLIQWFLLFGHDATTITKIYQSNKEKHRASKTIRNNTCLKMDSCFHNEYAPLFPQHKRSSLKKYEKCRFW